VALLCLVHLPLNVLFNYLVVLPAAMRIELPFFDLEDLRVHIEGALSVWRKLVVLWSRWVDGRLGMYDDKYELGAWAKLLGQVVIALLFGQPGCG